MKKPLKKSYRRSSKVTKMAEFNLAELLKADPDMNNPEYAEYLKQLKEHIEYNTFSAYDEEKSNARKEKGYYYMEMDFFSDLMSVSKKHISDLPDIKYVPRRIYDFNAKYFEQNGEHFIIADDLLLILLNVFSFGAFYMSMTAPKTKDNKGVSKFLVAAIDIFACRRKDNAPNDILTIITENDHATKFASFVARAMFSFALCHEIAHSALKDPNDDWIKEFHADALGYELLHSAILEHENLKHLEFFEGLRRAPLALFDILDLVEYYKQTILENVSSDKSHPPPTLRKAALLDQFDFGDNEECLNLYSVISERASALKYYIHKHRKGMREEITKIHESDYQ